MANNKPGFFSRLFSLGKSQNQNSFQQPGGIASQLPEPEQFKDEWPVYIFLFLSWFSTTAGLVGLIHGEREGFPWQTWFIIGLLIFGATMMMKRFLDRIFVAEDWFTRITAVLGYIFLMLVSVFFGFAFYWGQIESREQTFSTAFENIDRNTQELQNQNSALQELNSAYSALARQSESEYETEQTNGFTCESTPAGGPGNGPRREFRRQECSTFRQYAADVDSRIVELQTGVRPSIDVSALTCGQEPPDSIVPTPADQPTTEDDVQAPSLEDESGRRSAASLDSLRVSLNELRDLERSSDASDDAREIRNQKFQEINGQLRQFRSTFQTLVEGPLVAGRVQELRDRADEYNDPNFPRSGFSPIHGGIRSFKCYDVNFARDLSNTADLLADLSSRTLNLVNLEPIDGPKATREAFRRLWNTVAGIIPSPQQGQTPQQRALQLRAQIRQALLEQRSGVDNTAQLERLQGQLNVVLQNNASNRKMAANDWPSLLIASIVDLLILLATLMVPRKRKWFFNDATRRREQFDEDRPDTSLMESKLLREAEENIDEFRILRDYSITFGQNKYLVVPLKLSADKDLAADDRAISIFVDNLVLEGNAKREYMFYMTSTRNINRILSQKASPAAGRGNYSVWRVNKKFWLETFDSAIQQVREEITLNI